MEYVADILGGYLAGIPVAPTIAAVDRALAENASGRSTLGASFINSFKEMAANPIKFIKSPQFLYIWAVYGSTYATANACQSYCEERDIEVGIPKLISTFCVNMTLCIAKDKKFAELYAKPGAVTPKIPPTAYAAWVLRDIGSMGVFFTLPPIVGREIGKATGNDRAGFYAAQVGLPLVFQTIFTPIHLLGYDITNNPNNNLNQRVEFLKKDYFKNVGMRCVRQAPPWSFGTILNVELRKSFHDILGVPLKAQLDKK